MTESADDLLHAVLLPLHDDRLLLPNLALADSLAPAALRAPGGEVPDWFAGWLAWQHLDLPVLQFERLIGGSHDSGGRRGRIAVLQALTPGAGEPRCAVLCERHPQLLRLARDGLEALPLRASDVPELALARVRLRSDAREALIPDLAAIEQRLAALLDAGAALAARS
ncbi:chemotaxis protein CheW [Nevskia sp.]|uniref:chemotaxis protein CheW n=1 Tax=Nevskia sp. TaxID=1929292 RepID=UPI003F70BAD2